MQPKSRLVRPSLVTALISAMFAVAAPAALADTTNSSNWAGYAVHRPGVSFGTVSGSWRQPNAKCTPGVQTYSAFWVGLGGFSLNAPALEQTGTEVDCGVSGKVVSTAWYELVPAASTPIKLKVHPGDLVRASVTVRGNRVAIGLYDVTRHRGFKKTLNAGVIDVSSAEWIAEAPSQCVSLDSCQTLPLADFAPTRFDSAGVRSINGHSGSISDPTWGWTKIMLTPGGRRFAAYQGSGPAAGAAAPSSLLSNGHSFAVNWALASAQGNPFQPARRAAIRAGGALFHPGRG
jgi:Peptidase A4 family